MPKLVAMLRVKDGILFIDQWLSKITEIVDEIVVVDNGSTDGTLEKLKVHPKVMALAQTKGFHEGKDKILAYEMARQRKPDWIIWLDVDEIFEKRVTRSIIDDLMLDNRYVQYCFRLFNFHQDYNHFEAAWSKLWYITGPVRRMWKEQPTGYFLNTKIHNGPINGIHGNIKFTPYRIKHIGSVDKDYLKDKTDNYLNFDPGQAAMYIRHRDQVVKVWQWYEYEEHAFLVSAQILFLNFLWVVKYNAIRMKFFLRNPIHILRKFYAFLSRNNIS